MIAAMYALSLAIVTLYGLNLFILAVVRSRADRLLAGPVPAGSPVTLQPEGDASRPGEVTGEVPDASSKSTASGLVWPAVTVQLPLFNEQLVARRLIDACAALRYPPERLEIQVLDDSTDGTPQIVADAVRFWRSRGVSIVHLRRTQRTGFKAGALHQGMQSAQGEFIAILDADFLPNADFLQRAIPRFADEEVGLVQARWEHLNGAASMLTRLQAFGLDTHFGAEQAGRYAGGYFFGFNGTAGVWRKRTIIEAGGWSSDTLTEDLDLSYRAQLAGWRFIYDETLAVPAELPAEMSGFRAQQRRWTIGSVQTARKLIGRTLAARLGPRVRLEALAQLAAGFVYPFLFLLIVLHAPLGWLDAAGRGPGPEYFAILGLGAAGFAAFGMAQVIAQRSIRADWIWRMSRFPVFLAATLGMAFNNTLAVWTGMSGSRPAFERTPKYDIRSSAPTAWWRETYAQAHIPTIVWAEVALAIYAVAGILVLLASGSFTFLPFQVAILAGTCMVPSLSIRHALRVRSSTIPVGGPTVRAR